MRLVLIPVLLAIACMFAGVYGAIHNQISYSVSPEYFTQFKFHQFNIQNVPYRLGAAIVGWHAAWWMGLVIGGVLIPWGYSISGVAAFFGSMLRVFAAVALTTLVTGLAALAASYLLVDEESTARFAPYGNVVVDNVAFARAGTMHNFSYLGGLLGIIVGGWMIVRIRRRQLARWHDA